MSLSNKLKCRYCGKYSDRTTGIKVNLGFYCSYAHATSDGIRKANITRNKEAKASLRVRRNNLKTLTEYCDELQILVNKYVRLRDVNEGCISCDKDKYWSGQWHCSHYIPRGVSSFLRFNLWNMHKSCSVCNNYKSGNIGDYTPRLIEKIGQEKYDWIIANKYTLSSFDIDYIIRAKKIVRKAIKRVSN